MREVFLRRALSTLFKRDSMRAFLQGRGHDDFACRYTEGTCSVCCSLCWAWVGFFLCRLFLLAASPCIAPYAGSCGGAGLDTPINCHCSAATHLSLLSRPEAAHPQRFSGVLAH